jgi:hypothetical protein
MFNKLGRDKLKYHFMGVKIDRFSSKMAHKKNRRFVIFSVDFCPFCVEKWLIRIYRKTGPTKSTVLGPGPPPWRKHDFYRILLIFYDFGVFNRAGKSVSKIGIYSKPPPKSENYGVFLIYRDPFPFVNCFLLKFNYLKMV